MLNLKGSQFYLPIIRQYSRISIYWRQQTAKVLGISGSVWLKVLFFLLLYMNCSKIKNFNFLLILKFWNHRLHSLKLTVQKCKKKSSVKMQELFPHNYTLISSWWKVLSQLLGFSCISEIREKRYIMQMNSVFPTKLMQSMKILIVCHIWPEEQQKPSNNITSQKNIKLNFLIWTKDTATIRYMLHRWVNSANKSKKKHKTNSKNLKNRKRPLSEK